MHEKHLMRSAVPDGEAKFRIYPDGNLETLVTFEMGNHFLDGILFWHVGYRETFLLGKPFTLPVLDAFGNSLCKRHHT
jgi:hypothetical protein